MDLYVDAVMKRGFNNERVDSENEKGGWVCYRSFFLGGFLEAYLKCVLDAQCWF